MYEATRCVTQTVEIPISANRTGPDFCNQILVCSLLDPLVHVWQDRMSGCHEARLPSASARSCLWLSWHQVAQGQVKTETARARHVYTSRCHTHTHTRT